MLNIPLKLNKKNTIQELEEEIKVKIVILNYYLTSCKKYLKNSNKIEKIHKKLKKIKFNKECEYKLTIPNDNKNEEYLLFLFEVLVQYINYKRNNCLKIKKKSIVKRKNKKGKIPLILSAIAASVFIGGYIKAKIAGSYLNWDLTPVRVEGDVQAEFEGADPNFVFGKCKRMKRFICNLSENECKIGLADDEELENELQFLLEDDVVFEGELAFSPDEIADSVEETGESSAAEDSSTAAVDSSTAAEENAELTEVVDGLDTVDVLLVEADGETAGAATPVIAPLIGITVLVEAGIYGYSAYEQIKNCKKGPGYNKCVKNGLKTAAENVFVKPWESIGKKIKESFDKSGNATAKIAELVGKNANEVLNTEAKTAANSAKDINKTVETVGDKFKNIGKSFNSVFSDGANETKSILDGVKGAADSIGGSIGGAFGKRLRLNSLQRKELDELYNKSKTIKKWRCLIYNYYIAELIYTGIPNDKYFYCFYQFKKKIQDYKATLIYDKKFTNEDKDNLRKFAYIILVLNDWVNNVDKLAKSNINNKDELIKNAFSTPRAKEGIKKLSTDEKYELAIHSYNLAKNCSKYNRIPKKYHF